MQIYLNRIYTPGIFELYDTKTRSNIGNRISLDLMDITHGSVFDNWLSQHTTLSAI